MVCGFKTGLCGAEVEVGCVRVCVVVARLWRVWEVATSALPHTLPHEYLFTPIHIHITFTTFTTFTLTSCVVAQKLHEPSVIRCDGSTSLSAPATRLTNLSGRSHHSNQPFTPCHQPFTPCHQPFTP